MSEIKGRAETDEQKRFILERLYISWVNMPALRLGQLIVNSLADGKDLFYREDEDLITDIEVFQVDNEMKALEEMSVHDLLEWERKLDNE